MAEPLESLIKSLVKTVSGRQAAEALSNLAIALVALESSRGARTIIVADETLGSDDRQDGISNSAFPWEFVYFNSKDLDAQECAELLTKGGNAEVRIVVTYLSGCSPLLGNLITHVKLAPEVMQRYCELAEAENDPALKNLFARGAAVVQAKRLLPWLIRTANLPSVKDCIASISTPRYGSFDLPEIDFYLVNIGYLARLLLNEGNAAEGQPGVEYLRRLKKVLTMDSHESTRLALSTALGLLGEWEPILGHLGLGKPWRHDIALNVFKHWVPGPLDDDPQRELERAAHWIARQVWCRSDLTSDVRSTLDEILDTLEKKLGRRIAREELPPETSA